MRHRGAPSACVEGLSYDFRRHEEYHCTMAMHRRLFLGLTGALAGAAAFSTPLGAQRRRYALENMPAGKTLRDPAGRVVFSYLTRKPADVPLAGNSACCVHPFNTLDGERATDIAPPDHRDHRGIFFAWHDMEFSQPGETLRADFWGWGRFAPVEGRVIVNRKLDLVRQDATSADVVVVNDWMIADRKVLGETTRIRSSEARGARVLDFEMAFQSDFHVKLHQMAFTGFCFRCRKDGPYVFANPDGEVTLPDSSATNPASDWPARDWYSHTVTLPSGKVVASAVIDHPKNPPSLWHGPRPVSFLNPCITADGPVTIPMKQVLTLRYRAVAHDGAFPAGMLDELAGAWRRA